MKRRNPVEKIPGGGHVITGPEIALFQLMAVKSALHLESLGMKHRGGSLRKVWARHLGLKPSIKHADLIAHIQAMIDAHKAGRQGNPVRDPAHKKLLKGLASHFAMDEAALRKNPKRSPVNFSDYKVTVWEERDRLHIGIVDAATEQIGYADWWDDDARQMFEDGFFDARRLADSVLRYAADHGMLKKPSRAGAALRRNPQQQGPTEFARSHMKAWCKQNRCGPALQAQMWKMYLSDPEYWSDKGWPALERAAASEI